ncbi:MAG: CHASE3 domain-containing protein [Nitrospiraceae bacterium]|nr:CHASE3 domain-containing protein [Nitrospiraceae bacterium]
MRFTQIYKQTGLFVGIILAFIALESLVAASFLSLVHYKTANGGVAQTQQMLLEVESLMGQLSSAETHQRGFLVTGSSTYLQPYQHSVDSVERHLEQLSRLAAHNPEHRNRIAFLDQQIDRRVGEMTEALERRERDGFGAAKAVLVANAQGFTMESIREVANQVRLEEYERLKRGKADSEIWAVTTGALSVSFFLVTLVIFALFWVMLRLTLTVQQQAQTLAQLFAEQQPSRPS